MQKGRKKEKLNRIKTSNGQQGTMKANFLPLPECQMCPPCNCLFHLPNIFCTRLTCM